MIIIPMGSGNGKLLKLPLPAMHHAGIQLSEKEE